MTRSVSVIAGLALLALSWPLAATAQVLLCGETYATGLTTSNSFSLGIWANAGDLIEVSWTGPQPTVTVTSAPTLDDPLHLKTFAAGSFSVSQMGRYAVALNQPAPPAGTQESVTVRHAGRCFSQTHSLKCGQVVRTSIGGSGTIAILATDIYSYAVGAGDQPILTSPDAVRTTSNDGTTTTAVVIVGVPGTEYTVALQFVAGGTCIKQQLSCGRVDTTMLFANDQWDAYSFNANEGDVVRFVGPAGPDVYANDGSPVASPGSPLPVSGRYIALFRATGATADTYAVGLQFTKGGTCSLGLMACGVPISATVGKATRFDAYTISASAGDKGAFSAVGAQATIYAPDGSALVSASSSGVSNEVPFVDTGTYTVLVKSVGSAATDAYHLTLQFTFPRSRRCATPIACSETLTGTLSAPGQMNAYSFEALKDDAFVFAANGGKYATTGLNARAYLYGPDGAYLKSSSYGLSFANDAVVAPASGGYTLLVFGDAPATGAYGVSVQFLTSTCAKSLRCGQTLSGALTVPGQFAAYSFTAKDLDTIVFAAVGKPSNVWVDLYQKTGKVIKSIPFNTATQSFIKYSGNVDLTAGDYTLVVHDWDGQGTPEYSVSLQFLRGGTCATEIHCGRTLSGRLTSSTHTDAYIFDGRKGDVVVFTSDLAVIDLYGPDGTPVTVTKTGYEAGEQIGRNRRATLTATGAYVLLAHTKELAGVLTNEETGPYNISLRFIKGGAGDCFALPSIGCQGTPTATMVAPAQLDAYQFHGRQGAAVLVTVTADKLFNPRLFPVGDLYDRDGEWVGSTLTATGESVSLRLPTTGTYTLVVKDWYPSSQGVGAYGVSVRFTTGQCTTQLVPTATIATALSIPPQRDTFGMLVTSGSAMTVTLKTIAGPDVVTGYVFDPDGVLIGDVPDSTPKTLPLTAAGVHTILVGHPPTGAVRLFDGSVSYQISATLDGTCCARTTATSTVLALDQPAQGAVVGRPFPASGWAIDTGQDPNVDPGVDVVSLYAHPISGSGPPEFLGNASYGGERVDVGAFYGAGYTRSGFALTSSTSAFGRYRLAAYASSSVTGAFSASAFAEFTVADAPTITAQPQSQTIFTGQSATLSVSATSTTPQSYQWYVGTRGTTANPVAGALSSTFTTPALAFTTSFWVRVSNTGAWVDSDTAIVSVVRPADPLMAVDAPAAGALVGTSFDVMGWAIDRGVPVGPDEGTGVDQIHVWAFPQDGGAPFFAGLATYGLTRTDLAQIFGTQFGKSGYRLRVSNFPLGRYDLRVSPHSTVTGTFNQERFVRVTVAPPVSSPAMALDQPATGTTIGPSFTVSGWAVDRAAESGPGVDAIHVYAFPIVDGTIGSAVFLGQATYGTARGDVGGVFGAQFSDSGYTLQASGLPLGVYQVTAYARSTVSGTFNQQRSADITVASQPFMSLDGPVTGTTVVQPFITGGWAVDLAASAGTGIDAVHVWAFPTDGGPARFVDAASLNGTRADVGGLFGPAFVPSGFNFLMAGLSPGVYDIGVYARSTVTGTFNQARFARVTIADSGSPAAVVAGAPAGAEAVPVIVDPVGGGTSEMSLDSPRADQLPSGPLVVSGWALDREAVTGSGIGGIHVWAFRRDEADAAAVFLGVAESGVARPDVAAVYGPSSARSGWQLVTPALAPGEYDILAFAWNARTGRTEAVRAVRVIVLPLATRQTMVARMVLGVVSLRR